MSLQQMLLGVGAVATKPYMDDVFSTYLYDGTSVSNSGPAQTINNGIDVSGKGGLVWIKTRNGGLSHALFDTVRGKTKRIKTNSSDGENTSTSYLADFKTNGFEVGTSASTNSSDVTFASFTFAKQKGFFDVVTYTGNGSNQNISHSLGCVPGCIMVKRLDTTKDWCVYHRATGKSQHLELNNTDVAYTSTTRWNQTDPTASVFTVGDSSQTNTNAATYVAYVFAGGASTTGKAVEFDGDDYLSMPVSNTDFDWAASGSLTIECFLNLDNISGQAYNSIINRWTGSNYSFGLDVRNNGNLFFYFGSGTGSINTAESSGTTIATDTWYHVAVVKDGTTGRFFIDGKPCGTFTWNLASSNSSQALHVGNLADGNSYDIDGELSNVRMTMGQALYTTNFNVPSDPLTTTSQGAVATNVKLLCCNQSTTTGSTVAPGTITANGNPTVTTNNSLFDDTSANVFGESEDENVIKCGSYVGNGSSTGPEINLGWEPQWILLKNATASSRDWKIVDAMRGIVTGGDDASLRPNESNSEDDESVIDLTPTGFKITASNAHYNENGETIIYCALRRPDGYVGKPPELGTGVFTPILNATDSAEPFYRAANHVVDFALAKRYDTSVSWWSSSRLIQGKYLQTDTTSAEQSNSYQQFDYQSGYNSFTGSAGNNIGYLWKRHAGFDVVAYEGDGTLGKQVSHSLSKTPEMIWIKNRGESANWIVYHKGLNGGTNPEKYYLRLNTDDSEIYLPDLGLSTTLLFNDTAPTSSVVTLGNSGNLNKNGFNHLMMLFASANDINGNPISKVGYYDGSSSSITISTGFAPRFVIIKKSSGTDPWIVLDTARGWGSGNDNYLKLDSTAAQTAFDMGAPTSTGFTVSTDGSVNALNKKYIYYAHA